MNEFWIEISEAPNYQVSNLGRVRRHKIGPLMNKRPLGIIKQQAHNGYLIVKMMNEGKMITRSVHRLVAMAFISNTDNKPEVNHKDTNKHNNVVSNLEWNTPLENTHHSIKNKKYFHRPIIQTDIHGNIIAEFETIVIASKTVGLSITTIWGVCNGKRQTARGFCFMYKHNRDYRYGH